jgi:hypothetical protein
MPDTVIGMPLLDLLKAVAVLAKDLTLTSFLLWVLVMMLSGKIVRREELDTAVSRIAEANANTTKAEGKADWWRDKYLDQDAGTKQVLMTQGATIAALKATIDALPQRDRSS